MTNTLFFLPHEIDHDTYETLIREIEAVDRSERITLHCVTVGGATDAAVAISDYISHRGNVDGILFSRSYSCGPMIFAACERRYVSRNASLALHQSAFSWEAGVTQSSARSILTSIDSTHTIIADYLDRASYDAYDKSYWRAIVERVHHDSAEYLDAAFIKSVGLAKDISEYRKDE